MAKKNYTINSESINITNEVNNFPTIKAAKEFIAELVETDAINLDIDGEIGTIDGFNGDKALNTTTIRIEKGKVKYGRTSKILSDHEVNFTPSAKLNAVINGDSMEEEETPAETETETEEETPAETETEAEAVEA